MTIGDKFDEVVEKYPNQEALVVVHQNHCIKHLSGA